MKFDLSAQFLRIKPPDTSFSDAWESLCFVLLDAELEDSSLIRLLPPDKGVDILHRNKKKAFQCKSNEQGAFGSINANESIKSLKTAYSERDSLSWNWYSFATNANYTGNAFIAIKKAANDLGLIDEQIEFLGPEYWDKLCVRYTNLITDRFDYRIPLTKERVVQAFENQRYYPQYVSKYANEVNNSELVVRISNNRTPVVLEIPFSPDLTVEHLVDVVKDVLGLSLDWTNYHDLGTSAGPSISLTLDKKKQTFNKKIGDLNFGTSQELQFWITIVWRDERKKNTNSANDHELYCLVQSLGIFTETERKSLSYGERKSRTISRSKEIIETMLWSGAHKLKTI